MAEPFGFLNINKPAGMTSHDVVAKVRRAFKLKKVGHAGTLDPMATGVLILCVGGATRLSDYVMASTKRYLAQVHFGVTTDTYDAEGQTLQTRDASGLTRENVESALAPFRGAIQQIPPMYSAIKQGGRKLYDLARAGETIERQPRAVTIDHFTITDWQPPEVTLDVVCSAGTYIRSLAYDLGESLNVGAHLTGLVRAASGAFTLDHALELDSLLANPNWITLLIAPEKALAHYPAVQLTDADIVHIQHGRAVACTEDTVAQPTFAYDSSGNLVAIVQAEAGLWRPHKVFSIE